MYSFRCRLRPKFLALPSFLAFMIVSSAASAYAQASSGVINPLNFPGANLCIQIQAAIAANASANPQGIVIDARSATGVQNCTVNPFSGATIPGQLLLGSTVLKTTVPIVTPSVQAWQILGIGRGNNVNETGTLIQAVSGFPANGKVVRLGDGTALTFGNRIENLAIDCNGISGAIGLYSTDIQEESGGSNLVITSCPAREIWINGSGSDGAGPQFAMNYDFHDVEGLALNAGTSSTIACEFDGDNVTQPDGPHLLSGLTCSGSASHPIASAFVFDSFSSSTITNLNAESAATGYVIGNLAPLNGISFSSLAGGTITGSVVHITKPPVPANHNVTTDIALSNIVNASGTTAALITDDILGKTLTERTVGTYRVGIPEPSSGTFVPGYTHISDSPFSASQLSGLVLDNAADTTTGNLIKISSGLANTSPALVELDDRGTPRWNIGKDGTENFQIFDSAANVLRLQAVPNSNMEINAAGSGTFFMNLFSGTGGVIFCSGNGSTCSASINGSGAASFTSVAVPGLGASTRPLCTTNGGIITNVGCSTAAAAAGSATRTVAANGATTPASAMTPLQTPVGVDGVAPLNSPSFTGAPTTPGLAGVGTASLTLGSPEAIGGTDATVVCAADHLCDSYSGTVRLTTGSDAISSTGAQVVTVFLPVTRQNLPNCVVSVVTDAGSKPVATMVKFPSTSSIAVMSKSELSPLTPYDIIYLCGGN
jgi:hypothetical protein